MERLSGEVSCEADHPKFLESIKGQYVVDLGDGQFSERCDVDGSFFNSDAIPIIFWKDLTSPSLRLFFLTIGNDYFSITLLILRTDYFAIIHDMPDPPDPAR